MGMMDIFLEHKETLIAWFRALIAHSASRLNNSPGQARTLIRPIRKRADAG